MSTVAIAAPAPPSAAAVQLRRGGSTRRPGHIDVATLPAPTDGALAVSEWFDPYLAEHGHPVRSSYVELFWLPILGPTSMVLLRRLVIGFEHAPGGYRIGVQDTARSLGVGLPTSRQSTFLRALHRLVIFRTARFAGDALQVHRRLPSLHAGQVRRLPASLRAAHATAVTRHPARCGDDR